MSQQNSKAVQTDDDYITDNSLLESYGSDDYSRRGKPQGILHPSRLGASGVRPDSGLRVRFASPRQQRIEEKIAYHSFELNNLAKELDTVNNVHFGDTGYNRGGGHHHHMGHNFHGYSDHQYAGGGEDSSTLLSHDAFSVEASIDYIKPKTSSK